LVAAALAAGGLAHADGGAHWIYFKDKGVKPAELSSALAARLAELSPRARARRQRVRGDVGVDARDLAVHAGYLEAVRAAGVKIRVVSRWLNAVSVEGSPSRLAALARQPWVKEVRPVGRSVPPRPEQPPEPCLPASDPYGAAKPQLDQIKVPDLHSCGLTGKGVVVGIIDTGFSLKHKALAGVQVVAQRDFVFKDNVVENEAADVPGQDHHGTMILSLVAGNEPGTYRGVAPDAKVILAKVDYLPDDKPAEEDWFVEALQWLEQQGADLITTSCAWCTPPCTASQKDGVTEATSKAAGIAVQNGMIVLAAAGNSGPKATTILAPGDAKGVITVGSVDGTGTIASDSGRGPTADGRTKPDVVAPGVGGVVVDPTSTTKYRKANGTSIATPLVAGVVALLLQASPDTTPAEMHELLTSTASQAQSPDNTHGWGIIDGLKAAGLHCSCTDKDGDGQFAKHCGGKDCDDGDKAIFDGATEQCNGKDDDCDGAVPADEKDGDADGYLACADDCDDADGASNPGAGEVCGDKKDNNCDGQVDEGCQPSKGDGGGGDGDDGCGCVVASPARGGVGWIVLGLLLSLLFVRRRR
jgi:MYXO-CTERM domain-containing protein